MRFVVPPVSPLSSFFLAFAILSTLPAAAQTVIPAGVPLRIQIDHRYRVRPGRHIEGHLIAPIYSVDHKVLPVNTQVSGAIIGMRPASQQSRFHAILDGQFVPPSVPDIRFTSLRLPNGTTEPIQTTVIQRDATVVKMSAGKKRPGLRQMARQQIADRKREALETIHHPNLGDRMEKWVYTQLPWSPPTIWTGTQYDADLTAPIDIPGPVPAPMPRAEVHGTPTGIIDARLIVDLDSAKDKHGAPVTAVLTRPLLTPDGRQVLFPEGAKMEGIVTLVRPARWFARNGRLRFTFRSIETPGVKTAAVHGQLASAESASSANLKINDEGTAASHSGPGKYLAPMALGVMATSAFDGDATSNPVHTGVDSNGFGFAARVAAMASANAVLLRSFAVFAVSKSVYYRWIAKGHEIQFPKDTRIQIQLNQR
jgi:hypothetical protein